MHFSVKHAFFNRAKASFTADQLISPYLTLSNAWEIKPFQKMLHIDSVVQGGNYLLTHRQMLTETAGFQLSKVVKTLVISITSTDFSGEINNRAKASTTDINFLL